MSTPDLFSLFYEPLHRAVRAEELRLSSTAAGEGGVDYLDAESGLAAEWENALEQYIASNPAASQSNKANRDNDEGSGDIDATFCQLEQHTWALLQALYLQRTSPAPAASTSKSAFPYTPPLTVVQRAIAEDTALSELSVVRDWLHGTAYPSLHPAEIRKGYLTYSKNKLKQSIRTGSKADAQNLVQNLDPDATNRKSGSQRQQLDVQDANYDKALIRSLWEYVRVGELDQAIDMCRQSDTSWRAASLSGGKLFADEQLARASRACSAAEDGSVGFDSDIDPQEKIAQGNLRRKLWKSMCRSVAATGHLDPYEKALYAAIAGETAAVLPICQSWEDHLWARVNSLLEAEIDKILEEHSTSQYLLRSGSEGERAFSAPASATPTPSAGKSSLSQALQDIFNSLLGEPKLRLDARSPFHVAQSWIILNRTNDLLTSFVARLEENAESLDEPQLAHLLRFFTHLILFLRLISSSSSQDLPPLPEASVSTILTSYIRVLQAHSASASIIAFYCGSLGASEAIEAYSHYLHSEYLSTQNDHEGRPASERGERLRALLLSREAGLDLASIAQRVVELTLADVYTELPDWDAATDSILGGEGARSGTTEQDARNTELIRSVEWLTFDKDTYIDALHQANALMRYFLCAGSPHLARRIINQIPPDLLPSSAQMTDQPAPEDQISEYLDYTSFFDALQLHTQFMEVWSRRPPPHANKSEKMQFTTGIAGLTASMHDTILELLTSEWLILPDMAEQDPLESQRRLLELQRIRGAYIPELIFRLHHALLDTGREFVPGNLQKALDLSNVVADERYRLYMEFMGDGHSAAHEHNRLKDYLELVREASLASLERGGDPFIVPV